jgi:hypothetical protein
VESDVDMAVHHAADLARARGGHLASITLRGDGVASAVNTFAMAAFHRLGVSCSEIRFEAATGPVRLASVELQL